MYSINNHSTNRAVTHVFPTASKFNFFFPLQLRCGKWAISRSQPDRFAGESRAGAAPQLPAKPEERVVPVPLWQRLWHVPENHVTELLGHQRSVSLSLHLLCLKFLLGNQLGSLINIFEQKLGKWYPESDCYGQYGYFFSVDTLIWSILHCMILIW